MIAFYLLLMALLLVLYGTTAKPKFKLKSTNERKTWGERMADSGLIGYNKSQDYVLFSEERLVRSMDNRIRQLWEQRNRLVTIHVHIPKAGGTALAYALASSCNCSEKHTLTKDYANVCTDCRKVLVRHPKLAGWVRFPCTISRVTGWPCGVAHAPLALLRLAPYCTGEKTIEQRGRPLFIIMLRDPFERFVSEWKRWGGYRLNTLDWSAVNLPNINLTFPFFSHTNVTFIEAMARPTGERATLADLIALPRHFMLHNRYTKMMGGVDEDFDFNFTRVSAGSRWRSNVTDVTADVLTNGYMREHRDRALQNIQKAINVLPLLQERFEESLCVLEVILGSLQQFEWAAKNHSHGTGKYHQSKEDATVSPSLYKQWAEKNADDLLLYNYTVSVFDVQIRRAIRFLEEQVRAKTVRLTSVQRHQPHCFSLPAWKAVARALS